MAMVLWRHRQPTAPTGNGFSFSSKVELDHRYNPGEGSSDLVYDHVGVHSAGRGSNNSALDLAELAPAAVWDLADGQHHLVKVRQRQTLRTCESLTGRPEIKK